MDFELKDVVHGTYQIVNDIVNVTGSVILRSKGLTKIPWKFGYINGSFDCSYNELESLENCPEIVVMDFFCNNNKLISLKHGPNKVYRHYHCSHNKLKTLEFCPVHIGETFYCNFNLIETLEHVPINVLQKIEGWHYKHLMFVVPNEVKHIIDEYFKPKKSSKLKSFQDRLDSI